MELFATKVVERIVGPKRDDVRGGWREFRNREFLVK
jgi:hypothetical protein